MLRNPGKQPRRPAASAASGKLIGCLLAATLAGPVLGQGNAPMRADQPAKSQVTDAALRTDQGAAQLWGATARFVYDDDPALVKIKDELVLTIDDASLKAFGRSLDDAVRAEQRQFPRQNHVLKLQGIFKEIQIQNLSADDLTGLAHAIRAKLESNPDRMRDPARRQRLAAFENRLQAQAGTLGTAIGSSTSAAGPAATALAQTPADEPGPGPALDSVNPSLPSPGMIPADTATSSLPMAALTLAVLSLLGVLFLLLRSRAAPAAYRAAEPKPTTSRGQPALNPTQYEEVVKIVRAEVAKATASPRPAANLKAQGARPAGSVPPKAGSEEGGAATVTVSTAPVPVSPPSLDELTFGGAALVAAVEAPPAAPRLRTIYVNQQPLDGAFRRDNLADAPASYTIFEITVDEQQNPDYGTFVVTRNEAAHGGYIGSHHSILDPACTYNYPQGAVSRIITDAPGTVQRLPSGDWHITQKAQIHFV